MLPIPGLTGYLASPCGRIYSMRTGEGRELRQRWHKGYLTVLVRLGVGRSTKKRRDVHTLILRTYKGEKPFPEAVCRHLNGAASDNGERNLEWGTAEQNRADAVAHGTSITLLRGDAHPKTRITDAMIAEMRARVEAGETRGEVAKAYGIGRGWCGTLIAGKGRAPAPGVALTHP